MNREELERLVRQAADAPFTIHMSDGSSFEVKSPAMVAVGQHTAYVYVPNGDEVDTYERLSLLHIVRIEEKVPRSA
jgi:hypothetical protein